MTFLELTLSGTVMILAAAVFRALALRRLPKETFVALWWAAALRLLIPVELPSRLSVYTLLEALRPKAAPAPIAPAVTRPAPSQVLMIPTQPAALPPAPEPFPVWTALWIAGAVLLALWFLIRYVRWRRRFQESLPAEDCPGLDTCLRSRRRVRLRVTDQIAAPLTYGLLQPVILLPKTLDLRDEETVTCVLAHEMAHIRRLDGVFKLVLAAALCVHWFNPAVWLLYVLANRDMELRCDEAAVLALGEDSRERYALALIRLAELQKECVPLCGFSQKSGMEERIRAIMSIKKKTLLACFAALALVLGITTAFATSAKPDHADVDGDPEYLARVSAEAAAQWDELLAPYVPFGLEYAFDDPDHDGNGLTMAWEGHEVRGIYNEQTGEWITEHTGNGTYGPDAVELYTVYEDGRLTGLRLATGEEQADFDRQRKLSADTLKVKSLVDSVRYDSGNIYFTIPDGEEVWSIFLRGRVMTEDGMGMSVHYLEEESERAEWIPRMTYSFELAEAAYDELTMDVRYGNASYFYDLTLLLPENGAPLAQGPLPEGKADIPEGVTMIWPVDSGRVTNSYGDRTKPGGEGAVTHTGVDIGGMEPGTPIYAAAAGTVKEAGYDASLGNYVRLDHGNGLETVYAHCKSVEVKTGGSLTLGQTIATVGSTGQSTGPHLHFGILVDGESRDPERYFRNAAAGSVGQEGNTDLPVGTSEITLSPEPLSGGGNVDISLDAAKFYEAGNLPAFQLAFSRLSEKEQISWLDKIYKDGEVAFFSVSLDVVRPGSSLIDSFAERAYRDGSISFFSVLTGRMSEETLNTWLDRAVKDKKTSFQSVLLDKLGREDELDALEKKLDEQQFKEYETFGVTFTDNKRCFFRGRQARVFLDQHGNTSYFLTTDPEGDVYIKTTRDANGQLTGITYMTEAEVEEFLGESASYDMAVRDPDLIAAIGTNGENGYISMEESQLSWSPDREEIIAYQNWMEENHVTGYTIPLYDSEHNVIGTFQVGEGGSGSKTFEEIKAAEAQGWPNSKGSTLTEKEPIFKSIEEARSAVENGWVGDNYSGYYVER